MSALNTMPRSELNVTAQLDASEAAGEKACAITLANPGNRIAFFVRAEITQGKDGLEILPITYDDNYITVFPHETRTILATFTPRAGNTSAALRIEGYNVSKRVLSIP